MALSVSMALRGPAQNLLRCFNVLVQYRPQSIAHQTNSLATMKGERLMWDEDWNVDFFR